VVVLRSVISQKALILALLAKQTRLAYGRGDYLFRMSARISVPQGAGRYVSAGKKSGGRVFSDIREPGRSLSFQLQISEAFSMRHKDFVQKLQQKDDEEPTKQPPAGISRRTKRSFLDEACTAHRGRNFGGAR
jgi:hypothetical protein